MEHRRPGLFGPLVLITAGILLLLSNAGLLPSAFWEMAARLWPLLLILVGFDILIGRRSALAGLLFVLVWIVLVGGVLWLVFTQGSALFTTAGITDQISQPLGDVKSASVELQMAFSDTRVGSTGSDSADLVKATFQHSDGKRAVKNYSVAGSEARLGLKEEGANVFLGPAVSRWDINLSPDVPLAIRLNGGVGHTVLDASELKATSLSLDTGIGQLDVTTPKTGTVTMRLNGGIGSASVTIPPGVGASIRVSSGLGSIQVDSTRFPKFGDVYQTADYVNAANKIDIDVDGGIGRITIQ